MKFPLSARQAAEMLLALAKRKDYKQIHKAADDHYSETLRAVKSAFFVGRLTIHRVALKSALTGKDEQATLTIMSRAITATENALRPALEKVLTKILDASGKAAAKNLKSQLKRLRAAAPEIQDPKFDVTNPAAVEWIREHAAETVEGISETTREDIRDLVEQAFEEQFDVDELADQITDLIGDSARAETIARTETMRASNEGQQQLWDQAVENGLLTGTEKQEWIVTPDDRLCPICEPLDGMTADLDGTFEVDGDEIDGPPAHPNCRCTIGLSV